jgi:glycosyltransferase involved in cell wall biosynthesis
MGQAKMDRLSVSVAMCTYNGVRFLPTQLDSISRQTRLPRELVIQDDGSNDGTPELIELFARNAPFPVRFEVNSQRKGPARNFEACLARCAGDIVVLTDQDDIWLPDRVERTVTAYHDAEVTFTYADAPLIDDRGTLLGRTIFATVPVRSQDRSLLAIGGDLMPLILRYGVLYGATMSIRRDIIDAAAPFPSGWSHDEWLSLVGAAIGRAACMAPVMQYRQHSAQVVGAGVGGVQAILTGARHHSSSFYDAERLRYDAAMRAAGHDRILATSLRPHLEEKYRFLQARHQIHQGGVVGLAQAVRQVFQGNYARFASGFRSFAKDVSVAFRSTTGMG